MPVQRYTPVPGMGPQGYSHEMLQTQTGGSSQPQRYSGHSGYGSDGNNPFDTPGSQSASYQNPYDSYAQHGGPLPASSRGPQDESIPLYDPSQPAPSPRWAGHPVSRSVPGSVGVAGAPIPPEMRHSSTSNSLAHQNIPSEQYWADGSADAIRGGGAGGAGGVAGYTSQASRQRRNGWIKWGLIVFVVLAVIAIVVGVAVSQTTKNKNNGGSSSGNDSSSNDSAGVGGDPSKFDKDDRLHQSFWAFAYTPQGAQPPWCSIDSANVTKDIQLLSQLTTRLRLYGANCNATAEVLQAIQDTKVNMTIWPAVYVDSNETAYEQQVTAVTDALKTYGTGNVEGVIVGNEYILNTAGSDSNTSSTYLSAVSDITTKVSEVKQALQGLNLDKNLPVGTSDAGSVMSTTLGKGIDFFMANVHPWFGSVAIDDAATWTTNFFQDFDVSVADISTGTPEAYIAETGWPTDSMDSKSKNDGAGSPQGDASVANMQTFLDTFVCQANNNGTKYFYFEAFDEPWKAAEFGGVEPYWGLFSSDRTLKDVTIPQC